MSEKLKFKISSALKDIIGRDLITDDFIAVFELVKNSYDAHATRVDIIFEDINSGNGRIIIKDNGKGMNYDDLIKKWLFVAYSAKVEGTEDDNFDYRDNIYTNRPFAGAKGIGRFSCDRLGKQLYLETTKKERNPKTEVLITDWEQFEGDIKNEFVDIRVLHETKNQSDFDLEHGTILVIDDLRGEWDRNKLLKLKDSLAKLINPNKGKGEHNFKICIDVQEELEKDQIVQEEYEKVNGEVKNFIFETLGLKTTKIQSAISEDGKFITTELLDGGTLIYKIREHNKFSLLNSVNYTLYYLNMSAKLTFTRRMGLSSNQYGHVFLYKNGFRVYPYGEPGEDPLKIDVRKAQGHSRYLGTRELIGQIEVFSETNQIKETSSRGDGLIKTPTYKELEECFWEVLKRMEKYVVQVKRWGVGFEKESEDKDLSTRITDFIGKLSGGDDIIDFEYTDEFFNLIENSQSDSAEVVIKNLKKIALDSGDSKLLNEAKKASDKLEELKQARIESEIEKSSLEKEKSEVEEKLNVREKENELLRQASNDDIVELMTIEHHVNQATFRVEKYLKELYSIAKEDTNFSRSAVDWLNKITLENKKIASLVKFVRKANFDLLSSVVTEDMVSYIDQYISNVYKVDRIKIINQELIERVTVEYEDELNFVRSFVPLELNIVLDNLLDNSFKANSTQVRIELYLIKNSLIIDYSDNGVGIIENIKEDLFDFGVSTTEGSGIGLYHIRQIIEKLGGSVDLKDSKHGANFILQIPNSNTK